MPRAGTHETSRNRSDTAIMTCPELRPILKPLADLFGHFLELPPVTGTEDMTLWLRAAISRGRNLRVEHLVTSERIRTIPLLDTSLPTATLRTGPNPRSGIWLAATSTWSIRRRSGRSAGMRTWPRTWPRPFSCIWPARHAGRPKASCWAVGCTRRPATWRRTQTEGAALLSQPRLTTSDGQQAEIR